MAAYKSTDRLRDLLADNTLLLPVLSRFGISLGFGDASVAEVCAAHKVHTPTLLAVVNFISGRPFVPADVSPRVLTAYLRSAHKYFLEYILPNLRRRLIEAVSSGSRSNISIALLRFFDDYAAEVRNHMEYEETTVFVYVERLLDTRKHDDDYDITDFRHRHRPISQKLHELKELLICHFTAEPAQVDLLNSLLFDLVMCERDLITHCRVEDDLYIPAVERLERTIGERAGAVESADGSTDDVPLNDHGDIALTSRERDIIRCIAAGKSNKEIAEELYLSVHTVATHRRNICAKLDIHTAAGIAVYAMMHGMA